MKSNKKGVAVPKIEVNKVNEVFAISSGIYKIVASVTKTENGEKRISIQRTMSGHRDFSFENSTPEVVRAIGELLIEASKLAK